MIVTLLDRECAIVTAQEQTLERSATDSIVDLSSNVYANYVAVDGVCYLERLRNCESEVDERKQLLPNA
jgi:hypothetical protein